MTTQPKEIRFHSDSELAVALAADTAHLLQTSIDDKGAAILAVSGGKSPTPFFQKLSQQKISWSQVLITLVDERCVPRNHSESNATLVREHLLQNSAAYASFVPLVDEDTIQPTTISSLLTKARTRYAQISTPDVTVLGMGSDGHTASLFSDATELGTALERETNDRLISVQSPSAPYQRISMTLSEILASNHISLIFGGQEKLEVYERATSSCEKSLPISYVLCANHPSITVWINDV